MIPRPASLEQISRAIRRSPITALIGPRQCGKTTLARMFAKDRTAAYFDLESQLDLNRFKSGNRSRTFAVDAFLFPWTSEKS